MAGMISILAQDPKNAFLTFHKCGLGMLDPAQRDPKIDLIHIFEYIHQTFMKCQVWGSHKEIKILMFINCGLGGLRRA